MLDCAASNDMAWTVIGLMMSLSGIITGAAAFTVSEIIFDHLFRHYPKRPLTQSDPKKLPPIFIGWAAAISAMVTFGSLAPDLICH